MPRRRSSKGRSPKPVRKELSPADADLIRSLYHEHRRIFEEAQEEAKLVNARMMHVINGLLAPRYGLSAGQAYTAEEQPDGTVCLVEMRQSASQPAPTPPPANQPEPPAEEIEEGEEPEEEAEETDGAEEEEQEEAEQAEEEDKEKHSPIEWQGSGMPAGRKLSELA